MAKQKKSDCEVGGGIPPEYCWCMAQLRAADNFKPIFDALAERIARLEDQLHHLKAVRKTKCK